MSDETRIGREDLRAIASFQKAILFCILAYLLAIPTQFMLPPQFRLFLGGGVILLGLVSTVFVFLLATKVYSTGVGVLLAVLTLIPCVGLIVLLIINSKATSTLQLNGVRVGLLGANMADLQ